MLYLNIAVDTEENEEVVWVGLRLVEVGDEEDAPRVAATHPRQANTGLCQRLKQR